MHLLRGKGLAVVVSLVAGLAVAACGSSAKKPSSTTKSSASTTSTSTPSVSVASFTNDFTAMSALKSLASAGKGKIAAILPDTTSSTRYVEFDEPDLKKAMAMAGLPASDIIVQNGQGSDSTFLTDAQSDITNGASVLLIDPEDSGTGVTVENYAKAHGVAVIDYDRLVLGGPTENYVSFNNYVVGQDIGHGFVTCAAAWGVKHPNVIMMKGAPTDNNATQFYVGYYNDVLKADFSSGKMTQVATTAGTWMPPAALTEFEQAFTAHKNANSAVIPNDENGAPIITYLRSHGIKPNTFPTTGQDATLTGLQNILEGYQCGTVYKPVYKEAQAAVALALFLRAGKKAPASLMNGTTMDPTNHASVPSVLLTPYWVTPTTMKDTIVRDNFVPTNQLCSGAAKADCTKYGIS